MRSGDGQCNRGISRTLSRNIVFRDLSFEFTFVAIIYDVLLLLFSKVHYLIIVNKNHYAILYYSYVTMPSPCEQALD